MLSVSLIPFSIVAVISYYDYERILVEHTINNLKFFVENEKKNIEGKINSHFTELGLISNEIKLLQSVEDDKNFQTTESQENIDEALNEIRSVLIDTSKIYITDLDGQILTSTKKTEINKVQTYERFNEIKNSEVPTIDFILTNEGKPVILFSKTLVTGTNPIGVVFVEFEYQNIFEDINVNTLGKTGEFSIAKQISENEVLLIYPIIMEDEVILKRTVPMERANVPIIQSMAKKEDRFLNLTNLENEPVFAVTGYIEKANLGIAANINKSEIFASLQFSLFIIVFVYIIMSMSVVLISIFFSKTIAKPISEIVKISNQIANGNLNVKSNVKTNDELNQLSNSFNHMIESLKRKLKVEEELEDSKDQLRNERINTIGMLAAQIAHDIKNPLHVIKNSTEIIKKHHANKEIIAREIRRIDRGVVRISHQIDDVLNYINTTHVEFIQASLLKILQSAIEVLKMPETIEITIPKNDIIIECDPDKIESVFSNILLNAIQAIGNDKGQIKIEISQTQNTAIIKFENTGPEIDENILPRIFEPLFSTKEKGTGLGLVSCKNIIEQHGGVITAKPNPVVFTISIPMKH